MNGFHISLSIMIPLVMLLDRVSNVTVTLQGLFSPITPGIVGDSLWPFVSSVLEIFR